MAEEERLKGKAELRMRIGLTAGGPGLPSTSGQRVNASSGGNVGGMLALREEWPEVLSGNL